MFTVYAYSFMWLLRCMHNLSYVSLVLCFLYSRFFIFQCLAKQTKTYTCYQLSSLVSFIIEVRCNGHSCHAIIVSLGVGMLIMHEYLFERSNWRGRLLTSRILLFIVVNYDVHSFLSGRTSVNQIENYTSLSFNRVKFQLQWKRWLVCF